MLPSLTQFYFLSLLSCPCFEICSTNRRKFCDNVLTVLIHKVKLMPNCSACAMSHQFVLRKLDQDSGIWTVLFGFMSDFLCFLSKSFSLWLHQFSSVFPFSTCTLWRWTIFVTCISAGQWVAITLNFVQNLTKIRKWQNYKLELPFQLIPLKLLECEILKEKNSRRLPN